MFAIRATRYAFGMTTGCFNELLSSVITAAFALPHHEFPKSHHTIHQLAQPTVSEKISGGFIV